MSPKFKHTLFERLRMLKAMQTQALRDQATLADLRQQIAAEPEHDEPDGREGLYHMICDAQKAANDYSRALQPAINLTSTKLSAERSSERSS